MHPLMRLSVFLALAVMVFLTTTSTVNTTTVMPDPQSCFVSGMEIPHHGRTRTKNCSKEKVCRNGRLKTVKSGQTRCPTGSFCNGARKCVCTRRNKPHHACAMRNKHGLLTGCRTINELVFHPVDCK